MSVQGCASSLCLAMADTLRYLLFAVGPSLDRPSEYRTSLWRVDHVQLGRQCVSPHLDGHPAVSDIDLFARQRQARVSLPRSLHARQTLRPVLGHRTSFPLVLFLALRILRTDAPVSFYTTTRPVRPQTSPHLCPHRLRTSHASSKAWSLLTDTFVSASL